MPSTTLGALTISGTCTPTTVAPFGFVIPCGASLFNGGTRTLWINAQSQMACGCPAATGAAVGAPITSLEQALAPKTSMTVPTPPSGQVWTVVVIRRQSLEDLGIALIGGALVVAGLAGVGAVDLVRAALGHRR